MMQWRLVRWSRVQSAAVNSLSGLSSVFVVTAFFPWDAQYGVGFLFSGMHH